MAPYSHSRSVASNPDRNSAPTSSPPDRTAADAVPVKCWAWSIRSGRRPLNVLSSKRVLGRFRLTGGRFNYDSPVSKCLPALWRVGLPICELGPFRQSNAVKGVKRQPGGGEALLCSQIYDHLPKSVPPAVLSHQRPYFHTPRFRCDRILDECIEWTWHVKSRPFSVELFRTRYVPHVPHVRLTSRALSAPANMAAAALYSLSAEISVSNITLDQNADSRFHPYCCPDIQAPGLRSRMCIRFSVTSVNRHIAIIPASLT